MANEYFNRYNGLIINGQYKSLPFINLTVKSTDFYEIYVANKTRFDVLSEKYYDVPYYTWLILQANPTLGGLEFTIKTGTQIRIPYPLESTLFEYNEKIKQYIQLYGI